MTFRPSLVRRLQALRCDCRGRGYVVTEVPVPRDELPLRDQAWILLWGGHGVRRVRRPCPKHGSA